MGKFSALFLRKKDTILRQAKHIYRETTTNWIQIHIGKEMIVYRPKTWISVKNLLGWVGLLFLSLLSCRSINYYKWKCFKNAIHKPFQ